MQSVETRTQTGPSVATQGDALDRFFEGEKVDIARLASHLDALPDARRARATCGLSARQQAALFDAARGSLPLTLDYFVPPTLGSLKQAIHSGKNSLAFCKRFEKRFCRPDARAQHLFGYNENPASIQPVTGPGYFVCYEVEDHQVLIDYTQVPAADSARPAGWPEIRLNSEGMSRFIYNGTSDTMRGVSKHVSVGRAARAGKWMENWFVLCRREGA